jgi:pimeloyl-ACP methyl ester carboxylesterase
MKNFLHHTMMVNGFDMHYVTMGEGYPLVLLHGWPETWYAWKNMIPALAEQYTVIAPDLRGLGNSGIPKNGYDKRTMADDIFQLMTKLGYSHFFLVGHDWGGVVALNLAFDHPDMVEKLVIIEVAIPDESYEHLPLIARQGSIWHFAFHMINELPEILTKGREKEYIQWFNEWGSSNKEKLALSEESVNEYARCYSRPGSMKAGFELYRTVFQDIDRHRQWQQAKLNIPVLAIGGAKNFGSYVAMSLGKYAHDVREEVIEDCGHWVAEEQPERLLHTLVPFLQAN